jgi:tRNA threonylcarbamoyl adenosine modification protein YeaZ
MKILALEFSTEMRSAAVQLEMTVSSSSDGNTHTGNKPCHAAASDSREVGALTLVDAALKNAGLEREAIDCIAVGLGPGSYTGIRSAIALAQGWELARGVKLLGVSTVGCLAEQARAAGCYGLVNFVLDAQRGEFYLATYAIHASGVKEIEPLRIATLAAVRERERVGNLIVGPEVTRWFPGGRTLVPDASVIAVLAGRREDFVAGEKLEPVYLREVNFVKAAPPRLI